LLDEGRARVLTLIFVSPKMTARPLFLILCVAATVAVANPPENKSSAVTSHIPRQHVQSSALASIGYSKRLHILEIEFVNGAIYRYDEIPPSVYRELMSTDSKARYYDTNIKGNYRSVRVRPRLKNAVSR
jgi:KTSC domain-containing protein